MSLGDLGLIGNCQVSALIRRDGALIWSCMPRFDSAPVFGALLDEVGGGRFAIGAAEGGVGSQRYLPNTNILETRFDAEDGSFRVVDFAPRFLLYERSFRPTMIVRMVEPVGGTPRLRVRCEPVLGWGRERPGQEEGSHHVSYKGYDREVRLTTDAPLSYLHGEPFALTGRIHFAFTWGAPVEESLPSLCERFLQETSRYWQTWVKRCDIPAIHQEEVIRSALALKLHCFEDTGAIVASLTTSIPEAPDSGRTWDYRYCWLRDAYYTLGAFGLLGQWEEREQFTHYLLNVASSSKSMFLAPLYRIDGSADLAERVLPGWQGYLGHGPVRIGNAAALHRQNDVFGEMVLALTPFFLDARFREQVTAPVLDLVADLAREAIRVAGEPDAGIWEYRSEWRPQTFSTLMCWAAADRMSRIARRHRPADAAEFELAAAQLHARMLDEAIDLERGCLVADHGGTEVDAALLQAVSLRFLPATDPRLHATVDAIRADLESHGWLRRYRIDDGFGRPTVAFTLCTFWLVESLAILGRTDEARVLLDRVKSMNSPLGLLSEDVDPETGTMWGNFPQAYSHAGLIHAAFAASPPWAEIS